MKKLLLVFISVLTSAVSFGQIISTIAGNGTSGYTGDGSHAINAQLYTPCDVVVDAGGNIYFTEFNNHIIRKVSSSGIITTIAGTGVPGSTGDNSQASLALLNNPHGIALDSDGNILFTDTGNSSVRRINLTTGIITLVASGFNAPYHLACDNTGNIFVANTNSNSIVKIDATTGLTSTIVSISNRIYGIAIDSDNSIFYSTNGRKIFRYDPTTTISTLYAGNGIWGYNGENTAAVETQMKTIYDLDFDNQQNLIYLDSDDHRIRKVNKNTLIVSTIAGNGNLGYTGDGGAAIEASLNPSVGIFVDDCNHVYITDYIANVIRKSTITYSASETPVLTSQPICNGGTATIQISGNLNDAAQWMLYSFGCGTILQSNTSGNSFTVSPTENTLYYVRGEGSCVSPGVCENITIQVFNDPSFTIHPVGASLCEGSEHSMSVNATGGTPSLNYQWQFSDNGTDWNDVTDANSNSFTTPALTETIYYRCSATASGNGCNLAYSNVATIVVTPIPENDVCANSTIITSFPYNSGIINNSCSLSDIPMSSGCDGYSNNLWFRLQGTGNIMQASTISALTNFNTEIHVYTGECTHLDEIVCNDNSGTGTQSLAEWCSIESADYFISVGSNNVVGENGQFVLSITDFPMSQPILASSTPISICQGGNELLTANPGNNGNTVLWFTGSCSGTPVGDEYSISVSPLTDITYYARTGNTLCPGSVSNCVSVTINVENDISITQQPTGNSICSGGSWQLSVSATGGTPTLSYQWQSSTNNINFTNIDNAIFESYNTPNLSVTTYYRCIVIASGNGCEQSISNAAIVNVVNDPVFVLQPMGTSLCSGDFWTLTVTASGGTPELLLQWQSSANAVLWNNIDDATDETFNTPALTTTTYYRCVALASGSGCNQALSNTASVFVQDITAPVADILNLETVIADCSVLVTEYPTATDNCMGSITATTASPLSYDDQGNFIIIWQYNDGNGNISYQSQNVIVDDGTDPIPDVQVLATIYGECSAEITGVPTATDNCSGNINATTEDALVYYTQGAHYIEWTYTDANGNSSTQVQTVVIDDQTPPEMICANGITVDAESNHFYLITDTQFNPVSYSDNCLMTDLTNSFNNSSSLIGASLPEGENVITWTVTDAGGNSYNCELTIIVNEYVGNQIALMHETVLFPNPNEGTFTITLASGVNVNEIAITDITGRTLQSTQIENRDNNIHFNLGYLNDGMYFVSFVYNKTTVNLPFIIHH